MDVLPLTARACSKWSRRLRCDHTLLGVGVNGLGEERHDTSGGGEQVCVCVCVVVCVCVCVLTRSLTITPTLVAEQGYGACARKKDFPVQRKEHVLQEIHLGVTDTDKPDQCNFDLATRNLSIAAI